MWNETSSRKKSVKAIYIVKPVVHKYLSFYLNRQIVVKTSTKKRGKYPLYSPTSSSWPNIYNSCKIYVLFSYFYQSKKIEQLKKQKKAFTLFAYLYSEGKTDFLQMSHRSFFEQAQN